ncbi:MAG: arsenate reductase ArsC [alpha proteobacterium HIMB59]|jgi:arsenate reductase|nr:MAG: arsenate reductase ArsC [alpha proteobacterium HIMB59]|tara:strand:- start:92 stop:562 length:471 start_codon:yes stop_codon:yes gene_type:complete
MKKILVLCTGNSCRSIMAEGLINHFGKEDFQAFSAGSNPAGYVHPMSIKTLEKSGIFKSDYKSQSWDEFSDMHFDLVITVCDNAAGEACPIYLSSAPKVHWGVEDPAKFKGSEEDIENEFQRIFSILAKRTHAMVDIYRTDLQLEIQKLKEIGNLI